MAPTGSPPVAAEEEDDLDALLDGYADEAAGAIADSKKRAQEMELREGAPAAGAPSSLCPLMGGCPVPPQPRRHPPCAPPELDPRNRCPCNRYGAR